MLPTAEKQRHQPMQILLDRLVFHARHGVMPQERTVGGRFEVSLRLDIDDRDAHPALCHDRLSGTADYAEMCRLIRCEMDSPSALIEHVAGRIARRVVRNFPTVRQVEVSVRKCTPPVGGFDGAGAEVRHILRRQLVAWDFDGTIADTSAGIVRTMQATFRQLGLPQPEPQSVCATIGLPLVESIGLLSKLNGDALTQAASLYHELFETVGTTGITLFPGVAETLRRQHEAGFFVAVATSRGHISTESLCRRLGILDCIDAVMACEDVSAHKPDPAPVLELCRRFHVQPADTTVVGDTTFDMEMGLRAHATRRVGVGWGNHTLRQLTEAGATDCVIRAEDIEP